MAADSYDALLVVSFGGPEKDEDIMPFLENTLRGRSVPRERMLEVASHYRLFGGRSPINDHNHALVSAIRSELAAYGPAMPVYWGNRNWHPMLADTLREMKMNGVRNALAFVTSAYSSHSGCRQYLENIAQAREEAGTGSPLVEKLRVFYNHPRFIDAWVARVREALEKVPVERRGSARLIFTAHSIPLAMAGRCAYAQQLEETRRLICERLGFVSGPIVYQSRSGPASQPWLGPDILDALREVAGRRDVTDVVIVPVGFVSDHMEVVYDLDTQAKALSESLGLHYYRAGTPGWHPEFVRMVRDLIVERTDPHSERRAVGAFGPHPDVCAPDCCPRSGY